MDDPVAVLIVEDEAVVAADLAGKLAMLGYAIAGTAARGEDAIALARQHRPDIVLMDVQLRGPMDGIAAAEVIRFECDLPVVYLTAHSDPATLERARLTEPFGYILKPFEERELQTNIEMARYRHRLDRQLRENEQRLRLALDAAEQGAWEIDLESEAVVVSPRVCEIFGVDPAHPLGTRADWRAFVIAEDHERIRQAIEFAMKGGKAYWIEFRVRRPTDGAVRWVRSEGMPRRDGSGRARQLVGVIRDITEQKQAEEERETTVEFLRLVNDSKGTADLVKAATSFFHQQSGCEAVGIRLKQGDDYPYFETRGFPEEFVRLENHLCARDSQGEMMRDSAGDPILECMCGNVLGGRFDPSKPFFTARGSFWCNGTTELLATTSDADRQARTRNRCNGEGYESVALIALRASGESLGLLQFNDRTRGRFTPQGIAHWERFADYLAVAIAKTRAEEALREANEDLTRLNHAMVGREIRMIELKKEVNEACAKAGLPTPYDLTF